MLAPPAVLPTLGSNTGLNSRSEFSIGVDWLDLTYRNISESSTVGAILADFEALTGDVIDFSPNRPVMNGRMWTGSGDGALGTKVWFHCAFVNEFDEYIPAQLKVALNGSVLRGTNQHALACYLAATADDLSLDCTRIDIALDDHLKSVSLWKITNAIARGNFFNASYTEEIKSGLRGQDKGLALYFGSKNSDKRLCAYDKTAESNGTILGNRFEARFRRKAAEIVLLGWLKTYEESRETTARFLQNCVLGVIDFRDRSGDDPNRARCPQLEWFAKLCSRLGATPARISIEAVKQSAQKSIDWIAKSVAPSLATLKAILGTDYPSYIDSVVSSGMDRISNMRAKLIGLTDKEQLLY